MDLGAAIRTLRQAQGERERELGNAAREALTNPGVSSSEIMTVPAEKAPIRIGVKKGGTAELLTPAPLRVGVFYCLFLT